MFNSKTTIATFLTLALSGCSLAPDYQQPDKPQWLDSNWQSEQHPNGQWHKKALFTDQSEPLWWQQFNDPILNQLVDEAIAQNLLLRSAQQRVKLARSYQQAVSATSLPQIQLGVGYTAGMLSKTGPLGEPVHALNGLGQSLGMPGVSRHLDAAYTGLAIGWEPDIFGRTENLIEASKARAEQVEILRDATQLMVISALVENYLQHQGLINQQHVIIAQQEDLQAMQNMVASLHKSGLATGINLNEINSKLAEIDSILPQVNTAITAHHRRLSILLGKPDLDTRLSDKSPKLLNLEHAIPVGLAADLLTRRPDIRLAEREMKVANAELGVAIANQYPSFYLTGSPGVIASDFSDLFHHGSGAWQAGVGVNYALFDGGLRDALEQVANAQVEIAANNYQQTLISAFGEVDTLLIAYANSQQHLDAQHKSQQEVAKANSKSQSLQHAGLISQLQYLQAKSALHQSDLAVLQAQNQHNVLVVALYKALGGNWQPPAPM